MPAFDAVLDVAAARVEEQARGHCADEYRGTDSQQDAGGHENERERIDLHDMEIVGAQSGAGVGPKVTTLLGGRRLLAAAGVVIASACAPAALNSRDVMAMATQRKSLRKMRGDPSQGPALGRPEVPCRQDLTDTPFGPRGPVSHPVPTSKFRSQRRY